MLGFSTVSFFLSRIDRIYNRTGYKILSQLLHVSVNALMNVKKSWRDTKELKELATH